jgi:hypothetical protein
MQSQTQSRQQITDLRFLSGIEATTNRVGPKSFQSDPGFYKARKSRT